MGEYVPPVRRRSSRIKREPHHYADSVSSEEPHTMDVDVQEQVEPPPPPPPESPPQTSNMSMDVDAKPVHQSIPERRRYGKGKEKEKPPTLSGIMAQYPSISLKIQYFSLLKNANEIHKLIWNLIIPRIFDTDEYLKESIMQYVSTTNPSKVLTDNTIPVKREDGTTKNIKLKETQRPIYVALANIFYTIKQIENIPQQPQPEKSEDWVKQTDDVIDKHVLAFSKGLTYLMKQCDVDISDI